MSLPKLALFTPDQLEPIILEGTGTGTVRGWADQMLQGIAGLVAQSPQQYLSFGPMWWPVKALMQARGLIGGEAVDPDLVAQATLGKPEWDVAAAFAFHDNYQGGNLFTVITEEGDTVDYTLVDEDFA